MNESRFQIGDTVTIRQWDDMIDEYGCAYYVNGDPYIKVPFHFAEVMKDCCGRSFQIKEMSWSDKRQCFRYQLEGVFWSFSEQMFEEPSFLSAISDDTDNSMGISILLGGAME